MDCDRENVSYLTSEQKELWDKFGDP